MLVSKVRDCLTSSSPARPLPTSRSVRLPPGRTHSMRSLAYFIAVFVVALMLGIGSAWYMIERGSPLTTTKVGPWDGWVSEGNPNADPYTKAHLARSGRLPLTSTTARYFTASTDSAGRHTDFDLRIFDRGRAAQCALVVDCGLRRAWRLIDNPSARYSFNSEEMLRHADGSYRVKLSSNARPENWLPSGSGPERNLVLMLRIYSPRETDCLGHRPDSRTIASQRSSANHASKIATALYRPGARARGPHPHRRGAHSAVACTQERLGEAWPPGPANTMIETPAARPGQQVMPMMAPDVRYAFCRFDLAQGPVHLKGSVPNDLWLIALLHAGRRQFLHGSRRRHEKRADRSDHRHRRSDRGGGRRRCTRRVR